MYVTRINLKDYRNYNELDIEPDPKVNLILGENAQGKTNLLESIYLSSAGKSYRTSKDRDLISFGKEFARVTVEAEKSQLSTKVEIGLSSNSKKLIKKDGVMLKKLSQLMENIYVVIFSPEDLDLVKAEPENRRRFLDREFSQIRPLYFLNLVNYKKVLQNRNAYLKEESPKDGIMDVMDIQLSKYGGYLIWARNQFIEKLSRISSEIHSSITGGKESLFIEYEANTFDDDLLDQRKQQEKIYDKLYKSRAKDIRMRTTSIGPHKDDFRFLVNGIDMRSFGSQGQQRTCALSLKLAELYIIEKETGESPILLLDDVMSELDLSRQEFLIKTLENNQLFITTTHMDREIMEKFPSAKVYKVSDGQVFEQ